MEANRKEKCDFTVSYGGETWYINAAWVQSNGKPVWYDGTLFRDGVNIFRTFSPSQIIVPEIERKSA